jgi:hypothetical protein
MRIMNPKARITYRFEPARNNEAAKGRNAGRMVRIVPEDGRAGREERVSGAGRDWEELRFETDVIPWRSPFQDDPDALERLIRETDGQALGEEAGEGTDRAAGGTGGILPASDEIAEAGGDRSEVVPTAGDDARSGRHPDVSPMEREARAGDDYGAPDGYIVPRRRPPAPSWLRAAATVIGAVLTGALFGWLVMTLLVWQPEPPESARQEEPAGIAHPAGGTNVPDPDQAEGASGASGESAAVELPAARYYVLQYGVFSTEAGLEEALAQLRKAGYAAAADTSDGYRAYAGIAESREAAEALASAFDGVELYIRPLDMPAAVLEGQPEAVSALLTGTNDLIRTAGGLSASLLSAGGTNPIPEEAWSDWEASYRSWKEAAEALPDGASAGGGFGGIVEAVGRAADAFAAYRGLPAPGHLRDVQTALIEAAVARRDWLRAYGAL